MEALQDVYKKNISPSNTNCRSMFRNQRYKNKCLEGHLLFWCVCLIWWQPGDPSAHLLFAHDRETYSRYKLCTLNGEKTWCENKQIQSAGKPMCISRTALGVPKCWILLVYFTSRSFYRSFEKKGQHGDSRRDRQNTYSAHSNLKI